MKRFPDVDFMDFMDFVDFMDFMDFMDLEQRKGQRLSGRVSARMTTMLLQ